MIEQEHPFPSARRLYRREQTAFFRAAILIALLLFGIASAFVAMAQRSTAAEGPSTGLPLPRFATTRSTPINVRVGPGTRYDIAWVYVRAGTPVEIIQEFDTWRKIRDVDGSEGWVHQNLLSGRRAGIATPQGEAERIGLLAGREEDSSVRAWMTPGFPVEIGRCDGAWCEVVATDHPENGRPRQYSGYLRQDLLWGVYRGETFE
jgi:SH3-like domain-containing protein